jgi:hypothetical protein
VSPLNRVFFSQFLGVRILASSPIPIYPPDFHHIETMDSFWLGNALVVVFANVNAGESAAQITEDGAAAAEAIAVSMDRLWQDVLGNSGGLYAAIAKLGAFFGVSTLLLWVVQWAKAMVEDGSGAPISEAIWPLVVVILLANDASLLSTSTLGLREIINQTNQIVLQSALPYLG